MVIDIPSNLAPVYAINFAKYLYTCDYSPKFQYNFANMQNCHPFGMLVVASAIRNNINKYPNSTHEPININETQGCQFAASFGFFSSIGFDIGKIKEETAVGYNYIPIKAITASDLLSKYDSTLSLNEKIVRHAGELAATLVPHKSDEVRSALQYCFREIIRNTFEHAKVNKVWVCGQYWPSREEAEISILDEGIGIFKSLSSNPNIHVNTCQEANSLALQPGLTCALGVKQKKYDAWQNSGYGLYVASTLCVMSKGYFIINSGDSCVLLNNGGQKNYDSAIQGTAISLNIRTDTKQMKKFSRTLPLIVEEGEKRAKENGQSRILTASKVTTIASMIHHIEDTVRMQRTYEVIESESGGIPINSEVLFQPISNNARGEIHGVFDYNNQTYEGVLLNVDAVNRFLYVQNKQAIRVIVRKAKNGKYNLLEKNKYEKMCRKSKRE